VVILLPYLLWQIANGWPTLQYWVGYGTFRLHPTSIPDYAMDMFYAMNPVLLPMYAIGLWRLFHRLEDTHYGFLGVMFLATLVLSFLLHAKTWMLAELFMPLIAAGAVGVEEMAAGRHWALVLKPSAVAVMIAGGLLVAPASLPILPIESLPAYFDHFGISYGEYPINLAMRIGWEELVKQVARVYDELPPEERQVAGVYAYWYAPASAIDYFGPQYGLPHAVSGHLAYYLWGPGYSWDVMIMLMHDSTVMSLLYDRCEMKGRVFNPYTLPLNQLTIYVCRKPKIPPDEIWPHLEMYQ
jgi:hypothetical protein